MFTSHKSRGFLGLISVFVLSLSLTANAEDLEEGSALDSMEDLVGDLSDGDLADAIAEEESVVAEAEPEAEPAPEPNVAEADSSVKPSANPTSGAKPSSGKANRKPDALLILTSDQSAKVWINGRYRGRLGAKKSRRFPVRSGRVVITAKSKAGVTRKFVKRVSAKHSLKAKVYLGGKAKRTKGGKMRKAIKRTLNKKKNKRARKGGKRARKGGKRARKGGKRARK